MNSIVRKWGLIVLAGSVAACTTGTTRQEMVAPEVADHEEAVAAIQAVAVKSAEASRRSASNNYGAAPVSAYKAAPGMLSPYMAVAPYPAEAKRDRYQHLQENPVKLARADSVSTFSLDVDTGSYSNVRSHLQRGELPPADAVRVEEMINYFPYGYPSAEKNSAHPFVISQEVNLAPWNPQHLLMRIGVKASEQGVADMPSANLVFLVDVSGSMDEPNKLPLVKSSLSMLTQRLRPQDRVSLIVYAGRTAMELPSTSGKEKEKILAAISRLQAAGSTDGASALRMAYVEARANFIKGGINRILLATDGDFNVGVTGTEELIDMVKRERDTGITLTTLGFGTGNYNEEMMERVADVGNGNYGYIDTVDEAKKVLVDELSSTFNTVAKDVKVQVEFNPDQIAEWRLIGYENRQLKEEDFRNDKVDAGDVGSGKSVTALYELTPVGQPTLHGERRYGSAQSKGKSASTIRNELGEIRVRYKNPEGGASIEMKQVVSGSASARLHTSVMPSPDFRFAAAVAAFGQKLKGGNYLENFDYTQIASLARAGAAEDRDGYRQAFARLVEAAGALQPVKPAPRE